MGGESPSPGKDASMVMEHMLGTLGPRYPWIEPAQFEGDLDSKIKVGPCVIDLCASELSCPQGTTIISQRL
jgi:hypothetical protein